MKHKLDKDGYLEIKSTIETPSEETINLIKEELNDKDIFEDDQIKKLQEKRSKSGSNKIILAHLFIECLDNIKNNLNKIETKEDDEDKKLSKAKREISNYLKYRDDKKLRDLIEEYNDGKDYGAYFLELNIKDLAVEKKDQMNNVISMFFKIFEEDE